VTTPEHPPGRTFSALVFADEGAEPEVIQLAVTVMAAVLGQFVEQKYAPDETLNVSVGPSGGLVELLEEISTSATATSPAVTHRTDQTRAAMKANPLRFAALAFAHGTPVDAGPPLWTPR
jgi:hypothetical protein